MPAMSGERFESHARAPRRNDYLVRALLFLSSYALLFGLLALMLWASAAAWVALGLALAGTAWLFALLAAARRGSPDPYPVVAVKDMGGEVAGYVVGYLLPLLVHPEPTARELIAYAAFLVVVGLIYVQSDLVHINPLLYVLGHRVFAVRVEGNVERLLIARRPPVEGQVVIASHFTDALLIERSSR
jgi:hypothetical protein